MTAVHEAVVKNFSRLRLLRIELSKIGDSAFRDQSWRPFLNELRHLVFHHIWDKSLVIKDEVTDVEHLFALIFILNSLRLLYGNDNLLRRRILVHKSTLLMSLVGTPDLETLEDFKAYYVSSGRSAKTFCLELGVWTTHIPIDQVSLFMLNRLSDLCQKTKDRPKQHRGE